jgi:hypothetical protein
MTDIELIHAERAARQKAQGCPVYTGNDPYHATRSGMRSASCGDEWLRLRSERIKRGLAESEAVA